MPHKLLSIVIPTHGRPAYLMRAIQSALTSAPNDDLEIIVVPNGPDTTWETVRKSFAGDERVVFSPVERAHANTARNHGLKVSRGKYIRFLDDDDFLFPEAARQIANLESSGADIDSGVVVSIDQDGNNLGPLSFPREADFVCASASMTAFRLPIANVFRRSSIEFYRWREDVDRAQDYVWMLDLASLREWDLAFTNVPVGAWYQHDGRRTSTVRISEDHPTQVIDALVRLWTALVEADRLDESRGLAIAESLWLHIHSRFPFNPLYWHKIAKTALSIRPESKPAHPIFHKWPLDRLDPLSVEWLLYPGRRITSLYRELKWDLLGRDYRRHL